jgi:hypothetical protein
MATKLTGSGCNPQRFGNDDPALFLALASFRVRFHLFILTASSDDTRKERIRIEKNHLDSEVSFPTVEYIRIKRGAKHDPACCSR